MARWGTPEEVAGGVVFLGSPAAQFVTGTILVIDGGYLPCDNHVKDTAVTTPPTSTVMPLNEKWLPYKHPQPRESPPELIVPNAIPTDERIWVPVRERLVPSSPHVRVTRLLDEPLAGSQIRRALPTSSPSSRCTVLS